MTAAPTYTPHPADVIGRYHILDTPPESQFDYLARCAAEALAAPMASISFFDLATRDTSPRDTDSAANAASFWREWVKARFHITLETLSLAECFFLPAVEKRSGTDATGTWAVEDTWADRRLREHRMVRGAPFIRFYAGAPIYSRTQDLLGVISVYDTQPRTLEARDAEALSNFAMLAAARLEARAEKFRLQAHAAGSPAVGHPTLAINRSAESAAPLAYAENTNLAQTAGTTVKMVQAKTETVPAPGRADRAANESPPLPTPNVDADNTRLHNDLDAAVRARQSAEIKLAREKAFFDAAFQSVPSPVFVFDADGRMVRWNRSFREVSGSLDHEISAHSVFEFFAEEDRGSMRDTIRRISIDGETVRREVHLRNRDGRSIPVFFSGRLLEADGARYCVAVASDVSERRKTENELQVTKERLICALAGSGLALWDWNLETDSILNQDWRLAAGGEPVEARYTGAEVMGWVHPEDVGRFRAQRDAAVRGESEELNCEYRVKNSAGAWMWVNFLGRVTERDDRGHALRITGTTANITKRKRAEERAEALATRDPLTDLPNRTLLNDRLEQSIVNASRNHTQLAFMFIDLDRFKTINDSLGHDVGDELLKRVAARLSACVRASDTVARLGGDEFAVLLDNLGDNPHTGAQAVAEKMIAALAAPVLVKHHQLTTSCSIGIGMYPADGTDAQTLMRHADVAMYDAKAKGRANWQFFSHEMNERAQERLSMENYLRLAVRRNELSIHWQPRVSFKTGRITCLEALLRWHHPRHGVLDAEKFLSVAEDSGLIVPIGEWVINNAFAQTAAWRHSGNVGLKLALNISPAQLYDRNRLAQHVEQAAAKVDLPLHAVMIELTERALRKNTDDVAFVLRRLGALGVGLAIDNFGTGASSLLSIRQLPVSAIKVDSTFVQAIGHTDDTMARAIVAMTRSLQYSVIAEGVEREDQFRVLRDLGCDEYQGYYFSKPLPADELEAQFLEQN